MKIMQKVRWALIPAYIHYSIAREYYYVSWGDHLPKAWVSVTATPGPVPEDAKQGDGWFQAVAQMTKDDTGEVYWRRIYPFAFYNIKGARTEPELLDKDSDLFKDYVLIEGWKL